MLSLSITDKAWKVVEDKHAAEAAAEQIAQAAAASAAAEKGRLEREARIIAAAERQQALLRAERLEAKQTAAAQAASEKAAIAAEVERLLARTPLEVLQDEMAKMKRQMASRPAPLLLDDEREAFYSELAMRFKSSREELAAARGEIAELKKQMDTLLSGHFILRPANNPTGAFCPNGETVRWHYSDGPGSVSLRHPTMAHWQIERV